MAAHTRRTTFIVFAAALAATAPAVIAPAVATLPFIVFTVPTVEYLAAR